MTPKLLWVGLAASVGLAGCADYPPAYGPPPGEHVRWCFAHHPGYNPNTNLFPGRDGALHPCRIRPPAYGPPPPGYGPPPPAYGPPPPGAQLPPPPPPPPGG